MKTLLVLRHAKSSLNDSSLADFERHLNTRNSRSPLRTILLPRLPRLIYSRVLPFPICASVRESLASRYTILHLGANHASQESWKQLHCPGA